MKLTFLVFFTLTSWLNQPDWDQFRGPDGNGNSTNENLPTEWSENQNVAWKSDLPGLGWSSPIVVENRIYLTTAIEGNSNDLPSETQAQSNVLLNLVCLDLASGAILFNQTLIEQSPDAPDIHKKNSHASPTPIHDDGKLYCHFGHIGTVCTDLDGNILWKNQEHAYPPTHGNGASPIIVGDLLVFTCDGGSNASTLALEKSTGQLRWETPRGVESDRPFSFCTPTLISVDGIDQIISPGSDIVQSLDPKTGSVIWSARYSGFSVVPKPIYRDGLVFICTGFGPTSLLAIDPSGEGDVTETHIRWKHSSRSVPETPSIVTWQDQVIMVSDGGIATAFNLQSGKEVWKKRLGGNYSASPILAGSRIYFSSEEGETTLLDLTTNPPREIQRNRLAGSILASFAITGNDLLIRTDKSLYRIQSP